jgi:acetyl-CoA synthetase
MERFNWALEWFDVISENNDEIALWIIGDSDTESKVSFSALSKRSNQAANFLRRRGVERGDRLLLMLRNRQELWECMLASMKLGVVVIPSTVLLSESDVQDRVSRGVINCVVTEADQTQKFESSLDIVTPVVVGEKTEGWISYEEVTEEADSFEPDSVTYSEDPLLLYFTSGTTAAPKLVVHTHQSYPVGHLSTMYWIGLQPGDTHLNISSPGWAKHAWSSFFAPWNAQSTVLVYGYDRFDGEKFMETVVSSGVTTLCAPPTVWRMLIKLPLRNYPIKLREVVSAGEPLNPSVIEAIEAAWGITPRDGFGQTETSALIGNSPGQAIKPGFMGRPMPGYEITLRDLQGDLSREGEITLSTYPRPVGLMKGYLDRPIETGDFYRTGDMAEMDEEGYIRFIGRNDDIFKSADYRISPFELENLLLRHPAVSEAAIVPSPHPTRLSVPKAFLVLNPEFQASRKIALDIFRFCESKVSSFKRIRRLEFSVLPKTISGKIRRVELRQLESLGQDGSKRGTTEFWEEDFRDEL